ncbi:MAG TPA: hypothetical protein VFB66_23160 [Tepidisphaeraceae bacterium]|nr:hypothetical protein [Tepidisphaeraceae bacterium]
MDAAEKRRLKKLGKQLVQQQSRDLQARLAEANPAPAGSDEWVRNYRAQTTRERELRQSPPDRIPAAEASRGFVLDEMDAGPNFGGVPTWYVQCPACNDLLHTVPTQSVACTCGAVRLDLVEQALEVASNTRPRIVRLIPRGDAARRPWWRFW